jgi:hypothetical protein
MARYKTQKLLQAHPSQIEKIAEAIRSEFTNDGFEVMVDDLMSGGKDISITKGNMFKAVLGMKSALKVVLTPQSNGVMFDANVGIYGQQAIPTVISMFFFWPVLITQIWGLVEQSKLDDRALTIAESAIGAPATAPAAAAFYQNVPTKFCTNCGAQINQAAKFCPNCGAQLM